MGNLGVHSNFSMPFCLYEEEKGDEDEDDDNEGEAEVEELEERLLLVRQRSLIILKKRSYLFK